ncbi:hypothetical protein [Curtobacterium sp. ISL-83]|uniref:hypothetical protein n=1 Tax=Curtobacterium sp. ISL-83 TaxID=2819145 RepID=UPI001BED2F4D|nr:hypothetical protein [Curtobacterium sp. ISL-83]MBT2501420.1 hypothetical protein [Curtobacterium sp. ISL-83]
MDTTTWAEDFANQLEHAWHNQAFDEGTHADRIIDAVAGFIMAVELAAATTNDEILDVVSTHLAVTAGPDGDHDTTDLLHAAILNLAVTFLKPALDVLQGNEYDVRGVAQKMKEVILAFNEDR